MKKKVKKNKARLSRKLLYLAISLFLISLISFGWAVKDQVFPEPKVHYHAGFIVIKNNQIENFTDVKYQNFKPCTDKTVHKEPETEESKQLEKAHLHDYIGDVVHIESNDSKWHDLFKNLKYQINYKDAKAYLNGQIVTDFQEIKINPYDSLVVFAGQEVDTDKFINQAVTKQHIIDSEIKSEDCGGSL